MEQLKGNVKILIAGASRGIGKFLAESLSNSGHDVYGTYNATQPTGKTDYHLTQVDTTKEEQVKAWIDSIGFKADDRVVMINCVAINYNVTMINSETGKWLDTVMTNIKSQYLLIRHILPIMRERMFGRIILFSSVVPKIGIRGTSAYSTSKAALWGLSKAVTVENAKYGITSNNINLGYFDIGMIAEIPEKMLEGIVQSIPVKKLGQPVDILNTVEYLMKTDYIAGSEININGGMY